MSDKPSAAWYLAPIFLGIVGSAIMWYVLKDEEHQSAPKMVKKGWVIGIVLTVISIGWIPLMLIPMAVMDLDHQPMQEQMGQIPESIERMVIQGDPPEQTIEDTSQRTIEPVPEPVPIQEP